MSNPTASGMSEEAKGVADLNAEKAGRESVYRAYLDFASYVRGGTLQPHWMKDGSSFWYAEDAEEGWIVYQVDPFAETKTEFFDLKRLRSVLKAELGREPPGRGVPFSSFSFVDDSERQVRFAVGDQEFVLHLETYALTRAPQEWAERERRFRPKPVRRWYWWDRDQYEVLSPDGRWFATLRDHNLWLRSPGDDRMIELTTDGIEDYEWGFGMWHEWNASWSPDSRRLAVQKGDHRAVPKIPIVRWLRDPAEVEWFAYPTVGGAAPRLELYVVDIKSRGKIRVQCGDGCHHIHIVGWRPDGTELLFTCSDRTLERTELMAANPSTGATRIVLSEIEPGPILAGITRWHLLDDGDRFLWLSESDGWRHLYLYDLNGTLERRLTQGAFEVYRIVATDGERGWVYFTARGRQPRPYDAHLYRVPLDGGSVDRLTEAPAQHDSRAVPHRIQFSPTKRFFLDTYSTIAQPPVVELRRADGTLVRTVSEANIDALEEVGWVFPEEFVVKDADDATDLYGVLFKPYDFDPNKKYPLIDILYPGPQYYAHPDVFHAWFDSQANEARALAQLGFVTFMVDGRGTTGRGRDFRHAVYRNIGRHEIPDHAATVGQLAAANSFIDPDRVGIWGESWGGYFAIRALLTAPDVFHVGVASKPLIDLDRNASQLYESWAHMGRPQDNEDGYSQAANLPLVENLRGKLLLIHCTADVAGTPFPGTMRFVAALIAAGKHFDFIVLPDEEHSLSVTSKAYLREAVCRYFQDSLNP